MVYNEVLMQFQADILGVPVVRPKSLRPPRWRGVRRRPGRGLLEEVEDLRVNWGKDKEWDPKMDKALRDKEYKGWKKAVTRTFDWVEH